MIRRYTDLDYESVMKWFDSWGMKRIHRNVLSTYGFIIPNVAASWIYTTNSDLCYIENLIRNKEVKNCQKEIELLLDTCIKAAKSMGYKFIMANTENKSVLKHSVKLGAKIQTNQCLITLQIQ